MPSPLLTFVANVSRACGSVRPTVGNTVRGTTFATLSTSIKNANERTCAPLMKQLGFERSDIPSDGGDGNFSSNIYGDYWTHPSGVKVAVYTKFSPHQKEAQFHIAVSSWKDGVVAGY